MGTNRNRFYFRGFTPLGILNTILAFLFNRVLVLIVDTKSNEIMGWGIATSTDFPPEGEHV